MSFDQVQNILKNRRNREDAIHTKIYESVITLVNTHAANGAMYCVYVVPRLIIGCPLIDVQEAHAYIMDRLTNEGFTTFDISSEGTAAILINWELVSQKKESKISLSDDELFSKLASVKNGR